MITTYTSPSTKLTNAAEIIGHAVDYTTTMFAFKFLVVKQFSDFPMSGTDGRTYRC